MKLVLLFLLIAYYFNNSGCDETYTTKYDGVDLDDILSNERLLTAYVNCLLDHGPCTPDGKELKSNLPDAIDNNCKKCNKRQRDGADKVMGYIIDHRPDDWTKLEEKYNSDGSYKSKYLANKQSEGKKDKHNEDEKSQEKNKPDSKENKE